MKYLLSFVMTCTTLVVLAQKKDVQSAKNYLKNNELSEALASINLAFTNPKAETMADAWYTKFQVFHTLYKTKSTLVENPMMIALDAFTKTFETNPKFADPSLFTTTTANDFVNLIYSTAAGYLNAKDYENAFNLFSKCGDMFVAAKGPVFLDNAVIDTFANRAYMFAGLSANQVGKEDQALDNLNKAISSKVLNTSEMESCFRNTINIYSKKKDEKALLSEFEKAKAVLPNAAFILDEEINYYISIGKMDALKDKLEAAISKNPNDAMLNYNYGNLLYQIATAEKAPANAGELINQATTSYKKAASIDPENANIVYMLGVIPFNKGAEISVKIRDEKDNKKVVEYVKQRDQLFQEAIPFMEKAYEILRMKADFTPNDKNTIQGVGTALKGIYGLYSGKNSEYKQKYDDIVNFMKAALE